MHVDLIRPYRKSIIKHHPGVAIISNNVSLACVTMINPATVWLKIIEIPTYDLDEVTAGNYEHIDELSARFSQLFNKHSYEENTCVHTKLYLTTYMSLN